jgi:hypothetical protein
MSRYTSHLLRISISCVVVLGLLFGASQLVTSAPAERDAAIQELPLHDLEITLHRAAGNAFLVRFRNLTATPLQILKPIDGSEHAWVMPYHEFSLTDDQGGKYPMSGRCGMCGTPYSDTAWPADYLVTINPGEAFEYETYLNYHFNEEKEYLVSFRYVFRPESEFLRDGVHRYPRELWQGEAKSPTIRVRLKPQQAVVG